MRSLLLVLVAVPLLAPGSFAQSLETLVVTVGGDSMGPGCTLFAPPPLVSTFFGSAGPLLPMPGLPPCGVAGDVRSATSRFAPLEDEMTISTGWGTGFLTGTTHVRARYHVLVAQASSVYTGASSSITVKGTEGLAVSRDILTVSSPSHPAGTLGSVRLLFLVSGELGTTGIGTSDVELALRIGNGTAQRVFRAQVDGPTSLPFVWSASGNGLAGFARVLGSMSGADLVDSLPLPVTFGTPTDVEIALLVFTTPGLTATMGSSFQVRVAGLEVHDSSNALVPDATWRWASPGGLVKPR